MKKTLKLLIVMMIAFLFHSFVVFAESEDNVQFSVSAILPDNQLDKDQAYFDLRMTPGQKETIEVQISNTSSEKATFSVSVNQAYTNASGFIKYDEHDVKKDSSLKYDIDDIATYDKSIEVDANSSKMLPIELTMPEESFDGKIMAGIQVTKDMDDDQKGITNLYSYVIGLRLTETDTEVKRELNLLDIKPAVSFNRTSVVAKLQNPTMDSYGKLKYKVKVTNLKTKKVEKEETFDSGMEMAPNSTYDFAIDWNDKALVAGKYNLDLVVSDAKSNEWKFNEDFEVTKSDANKVNEVAISGNSSGYNIWLIVALIVIVVLVLIIVLNFNRQRKKRKELERRENEGTRSK